MPDTTPPVAEPNAAREPIWNRPQRGARGPVPEHNRNEIAAAAIVLADSDGLTAASMRAVAGRLGMTAGSLYRYLSSRDDLLDLMVDAALAELPLNRESVGTWLDNLVALANDQLSLYRRHPWLLEVNPSGGALGPHGLDYFDDCLRIMAPVRTAIEAKMETIAMITGVVSLFARGTSDQRAPVAPSSIFAAVSPHRHPHLVAALAEPHRASPRPNIFERTIRSVVRGLLDDDN